MVSEKGRCPSIVLENKFLLLFGNGWIVITEPEQKSRAETMTPTPPYVWVSSKTISLLNVDAVSWIADISQLQEAFCTLQSLLPLHLVRPALSSMGGFEGHLYPGLFLFFYGLYHARLVFRALICNCPVQYVPRRPWSKGGWARLPQIYYVGLVKILSACILVAQELHSIPGHFVLITKMYYQKNFLYRKQWQHLTMYMTFFLSGCVDVVSQNLLPQRCAALEQGAQALGVLLLLLLMVSHTQDTEGVELQSHVLLTQAIFLLMLVVIAELWAPNMPQLWLMKAFLYMMIGSWLMQIGFMLYKPISGHKWMDDDKNDIIFVTTFFCWHVAFIAMIMIWVYGFSFWWYRYLC